MVDFDLAGHSYTRPASVMQGQSADVRLDSILKTLLRSNHFLNLVCDAGVAPLRLEVSPKPNHKMIWRPNQVQFPHLRATNAASYFTVGMMQKTLMKARTQSFLEEMNRYNTC